MSNPCPPDTTPPLAKLANLAKSGSPSGAAVLATLCRTLAVDPTVVKVRISLGELGEAIASGDIPATLVTRYAPAIGKARARRP